MSGAGNIPGPGPARQFDLSGILGRGQSMKPPGLRVDKHGGLQGARQAFQGDCRRLAGRIHQTITKENTMANSSGNLKVRKDMLNADVYSWHAAEPDDPHKIKQDAVMFNRKEGYEVIPMIQKVADALGFETVDDVKRIEAAIANELPGNVRSRENVYNWLVKYFETH